jgi:hypothetical protein
MTEDLRGRDIIDSRDVIARIEHLRQLRQPGPVDLGPQDNKQAQDDLFEELSALERLAEEAEPYAPDWPHGAALIADDHFEDYTRQLAEDIGAIDRDAVCPACPIDWEGAADALKMYYTSVDFDGETYWVR